MGQESGWEQVSWVSQAAINVSAGAVVLICSSGTSSKLLWLLAKFSSSRW